jgi:hypothetical protein
MADKTQLPPEAPGSASVSAGSEEGQKFGLPAARWPSASRSTWRSAAT